VIGVTQVNYLDKQRQLALIIFVTICITYFAEHFLRSTASALTPVLIQELGITRGAMGLLITGYFLIYGIMQFPAGILADILGPRRSIIWFTALTILGGILFWASYRYDLLFAAQFIMGIGTSVFYINALTLVTRWFPSNKKATAVGILSATSGVGAFTSYLGFPLAIELWGNWRILYLLMLGVLSVNWVMNYIFIKNSPNENPQNKSQRINIVESFKYTFSERRLYPLFFGYMMMGLNYILFQWANQYLIEAKHLTYVQAGLVTSIGTVAGFIGCIAFGALSDKIRQRRLPVVAFIGVYTVLLACLIALPAGLSVVVYAGLWSFLSLSGSTWVLFPSMVGEVVPVARASMGFAVMNGLMMIISSLSTPIYGSLVDVTGSFFIPTILSLGFSLLDFLVLFRFLKETYGKVVNE
jgi:MFS family permease